MNAMGNLVGRLSLRRAGGGWVGDCPLCVKCDSLTVTERAGKVIGICGSCNDHAGIATLIAPMIEFADSVVV